MHMWRVYVGGDEVIPPWFIALQKVKACGVGGGICWTPFHFSLLQPPQPVLSAPFSPNASSKQWHFSGKPHLNVQSSFTPAMCLSVDLCVCRLPSRAPAGHRKWRASPFPPNQYHRCEWIPVFISFNTLGKRRGYEKSDDGERWRRWQKVVILPFHLSLPKKGCGKWLVAQDARQHEPFPTGLKMMKIFSPPYAFFPSSMHAWLTTSVFHYSSNKAESDRATGEALNFTFCLFFFSPNSIPEIPEARNLNWKTEIWCSFAFGGRPIKG